MDGKFLYMVLYMAVQAMLPSFIHGPPTATSLQDDVIRRLMGTLGFDPEVGLGEIQELHM